MATRMTPTGRSRSARNVHGLLVAWIGTASHHPATIVVNVGYDDDS